MVGAGAALIALIALVSLALPLSFVQAVGDDTGWYVDSYTDSFPVSDFGGGGDTGWYVDSYTDSYPSSGDTTGWYVDSYTDSYPGSSDFGGGSGFSMPSFGGSGGSGFSMPSFGMPSFANQALRQQTGMPSISNTNTNINTNTCTTNSCNYYDNSVFNNPITTTIAQDDHSAKVIYADQEDRKSKKSRDRQDYNDCYGSNYGYGYNDCYQPMPQYPQYPPVAYNPTPYVTLSAVPYTGLELGPAGEALYWAFLVLWCLVAAYLIVVKRVQNKVVSALNGFLFGASTATATTAHATHAPSRVHVAEAKMDVADSGIDSFIASQIAKRS